MKRINLAIAQQTMRIRTEKELLAIVDDSRIGEIIMFVEKRNEKKDKYRWRDKKRITYYPIEAMDRVAKILEKHKIDIVHTHNFPDKIGKYFIGIRDSRRFNSKYNLNFKVVHEVHDTGWFYTEMGHYSNRKMKVRHDEKYVMQKSDGLVFCSETQLMFLWGKYEFPYNRGIIIYPSASKYHVPSMIKKPKNKQLTLVYCGSLGNDMGDYRLIFKDLLDKGFKIVIYTSRPGVSAQYEDEGIEIRSEWRYREMLKDLSKMDGGIIPDYNGRNIQYYTIFGNKLWDYLGAGIPIVYHQYCPWMMKNFVRCERVGYSFDEINSINIKSARARVQKHRDKYLMENNINKLIKLYYDVIKRK